jgi:hypothetical protein
MAGYQAFEIFYEIGNVLNQNTSYVQGLRNYPLTFGNPRWLAKYHREEVAKLTDEKILSYLSQCILVHNAKIYSENQLAGTLVLLR